MSAGRVATGRIVLAVFFALTWSLAGSQDSSSWWGWNPFGPSATTVAPDLSFLNGTNFTYVFPNMTVPVPSTPAPGWILNTWNSFINPFTGGSSRSLDQDSEIDESGNSNSSDFEDSIDNDGNCIDGNCTLGGDRFEHGRHIVVDTTPNKTSFSFNGTGLLWESNVEVLPSGIRWTGEWKVGRNLADNATEIDYPEHLEQIQNSTAFNGSKSARALDSWNTTFANSSEYISIYIVSDASSNRTGFGRDINGSEFDHLNVTGDNSTAYDVDARRTEVGRSFNNNDTRNTSATSDNSDVDNSLDWNFNENCTDGNCTANFGQPTEQLEGDDRSEHGRHIVFDVTPNRTHFSFNGTGLFWSSDVEVGPGGIVTARWKVGRDLDDNDTYSVNATEIEYPEQLEESQNSTVLNGSKSASALDFWNATSDNSSEYIDIYDSPNRTGFGRELNGSEFDHLNVTENTSAVYETSPRPEFGRSLDFNDTRNSSIAFNTSIASDNEREDSGRLIFLFDEVNNSSVRNPDNSTFSSLSNTSFIGPENDTVIVIVDNSSDLGIRSFRAIDLTNKYLTTDYLGSTHQNISIDNSTDFSNNMSFLTNSSSLNSSSATIQGNVSLICNCPFEDASYSSINDGDIQFPIEQDQNKTSTGTLCTCGLDRSGSSRSFDSNDTLSGIYSGNISSQLNTSASNNTSGEPGNPVVESKTLSLGLENDTSLDVGNSTSRNESGRSLDSSNSTINATLFKYVSLFDSLAPVSENKLNGSDPEDLVTPLESFTGVPTTNQPEENEFIPIGSKAVGSEHSHKESGHQSDADFDSEEDSKRPFLKTPEEQHRYHELKRGEIGDAIVFPGEEFTEGPSQDFGDEGGFQLPNSGHRLENFHYVVARNIRHRNPGSEYFQALDSFRQPIATISPVSPQGKDPLSKPL